MANIALETRKLDQLSIPSWTEAEFKPRRWTAKTGSNWAPAQILDSEHNFKWNQLVLAASQIWDAARIL